MAKKIKSTVKVGEGNPINTNPEKLPMSMTIEEMARICYREHVAVTITLEEKKEKEWME